MMMFETSKHVPKSEKRCCVFKISTTLKICECLSISNCMRKSFDYLLITYKQQATSTLLEEKLTCEFKHKNKFTLSKSCMIMEQFLLLQKAVFINSWIEELDHKVKENLPTAFFSAVFRLVEKLCRVQGYFRRETKLKSTKKRLFCSK